MKAWSEVVMKKGDANTILVADSYYIDAAGRGYMLEKNVKFICAANPQRFLPVRDLIKKEVKKPTDWALAWREESKEVFVYVWDADEKIGKKCVISNAFAKWSTKPPAKAVPVYDEYGVAFDLVDSFNEGLTGRTFPHKKGGRNRRGELQALNDFYFSSILQNVINAYVDLGGSAADFRTHCRHLADELYQLASTWDDQ
jgi:hypothetical protein